MNKLEMAHDYFLGIISNPSVTLRSEDMQVIQHNAWVYADAMQAEADKREEQNAVDGCSSPEWQPDWSQAPDGCRFFCVASNGGYGFFTNLEPEFMGDYFYVGCGGLMIESHGYTGSWRNSVRKRP